MSHAGVARGRFPVTTKAAIPNKANQSYGEHGQEYQEANQKQSHVEAGRFVPVQLERLHFYKSPLAIRGGKEQCAVAGIGDFRGVEECCDLQEGGI